jgi:predicted flavoprotein YhiN
MSAITKTDVVVLGAGAAGMMCAIEAGRRGRSVGVIDHAKAPGEKIRISGGGRCNFTNLHCTPKNFISNNPHFAISALKSFTQHDFVDRVKARGIAFHEKTLGQLFCDGSAREIIAMLTDDMREAGARLELSDRDPRSQRSGRRFPDPDQRRNLALQLAGRRHRRQVDPQDGGYRPGLRTRPAVRP